MNAVTGVKLGISTAWALSSIAVLMLTFLTDHYRGGYEDMLSNACILFFAGLFFAASAVVAAVVVRLKSPERLSNTWFICGIAHVTLSLLFFGGVLLLARLST